MEVLLFTLIAAVALASGAMVVLQRNAMYSALFLVLNFFCLAVFYVLLNAYFLAVVQIAVYAGAIMVLMLFVIMLLNVAHPEPIDPRFSVLKGFGALIALALLGELAYIVLRGGATLAAGPAAIATGDATHTQGLASLLFTRYLFPFEVTSILLLAAIMGAAMLARKRRERL